jgi:SAM-dependent methyltransferase
MDLELKRSKKKAVTITEKVKERIKALPIFYEICRFILNPGFRFYLPKRNRILKSILALKENGKILNIGSGYLKLPGIINADIHPYEGVDVISDAHSLPFHSEKFEAVILENLLEHVSNPFQVVKESFEVLKKGGILFVEVPFLYEFHNSPADYYRFTLSGVELLLNDFEKIDGGISVGPMGTLNAVMRNYLAIIFSFGNSGLYEFLNMGLGVILFPLKFLDFFLVKFKGSENIASILYFIGKK